MNLCDLAQLVGGALCAFFSGLVGVEATTNLNPLLLAYCIGLVVISAWLVKRSLKHYRGWG